MNVSELVTHINELSDEFEDPELVVQFINDAIAKINVECDSIFPSLTLTSEEIPLPEKWIRALLVPFGVGRIKQRDSSQFEYTDSYNEFLANLEEFKARYEIPEEFRDPDSSSSAGYESDLFKNPTWIYGGF